MARLGLLFVLLKVTRDFKFFSVTMIYERQIQFLIDVSAAQKYPHLVPTLW